MLINKTIVIDCAQFHCIKNINLLKGKMIIIRTDIDTCYKRCIERFNKKFPNATKEERIKACDEYVKSARATGYSDEKLFSGARWRIVDQYIPEIYEKHEKYEQGIKEIQGRYLLFVDCQVANPTA